MYNTEQSTPELIAMQLGKVVKAAVEFLADTADTDLEQALKDAINEAVEGVVFEES